MRIDGLWMVCDDGIVRPVVRGEVRAENGTWIEASLLIDTGADRTVLSADVLDLLGLSRETPAERLEGVGGRADSVIVSTTLRLRRETGAMVSFEGRLAAFTDPAALDMSVLGRDLINLFPLVVARPQDVVCLLGPGHRCLIVTE